MPSPNLEDLLRDLIKVQVANLVQTIDIRAPKPTKYQQFVSELAQNYDVPSPKD